MPGKWLTRPNCEVRITSLSGPQLSSHRKLHQPSTSQLLLPLILQDEADVEIFFEEVLEDNPDFFEEATDEQITVIFEAAPELFNEASDEVKEELEAEINVFAGGFEDYVPEDSTINVDDRRSIIAVTSTAIVATTAVATRPSPPQPRPTTPTPPRPSSPSAVSPSGPTTRRNND